MAEDSRSTSRSAATIFITGLVSLVVGVSGGLLVNRLTERRPGLEYEFVAPAVFAGEKESLAVLTLKVSNPAQREVENVTCALPLGSLELREPRVVGLQRGAYSQIVKDGAFQLDVPYLNPGETFSVQLLVVSNKPEITIQEPSVRAKGIVGVNRAMRPKTTPLREILPFVGAALSALFPIALLWLRRHPPAVFFTKQHTGDERDIVAFVFEMHGFHEEAEWARKSERSLSYWAEADRLTEVVLRDGNHDRIANAITCLKHLLDYASIPDPTELLIHFDIACLALAAGDEVAANKHLVAARHRKHRVIEKRLMMNDRLAAFAMKDDTARLTQR